MVKVVVPIVPSRSVRAVINPVHATMRKAVRVVIHPVVPTEVTVSVAQAVTVSNAKEATASSAKAVISLVHATMRKVVRAVTASSVHAGSSAATTIPMPNTA